LIWPAAIVRSTQRQVIVLVAASVILAHVIQFSLFMGMREHEGLAHFPDRTSVRLLAGLYSANPALRPELLRDAAAAGLTMREIPDSVVSACAAKPDSPPCPPEGLSPDTPRVRVSPDMWLAAEPIPRPPRPPRRIGLAGMVALVGFPALALSLWASRVVTAPLQRLTAQAECVDPETVSAPLKVEGTTEMRLLAEAFNRLILRLTRYASDQRRMLAAVSHDLRTPLTRLRLRAETIAEPAARQKMVHDITTMQTLIDSALYLLQAQDGGASAVRVDLAALLQTVADDMADGGVNVALGPMKPLAAHTDPAMLKRAVENLIENAAKYGGGGTLALSQTNGEAVIEVADSGPGLTDAEKTQVFEPWYRADTARGGQGTGLGLAIVKAVMRSLGGRVELADAVPHGLAARLVLPL
jgi:signal transduction histidine kinase